VELVVSAGPGILEDVMAEVPGAMDILRGELAEAQMQVAALVAQAEMLAMMRRSFEEMLCALVREHGEKVDEHTYRLAVGKDAMAFSAQPFVSAMEPLLETGGMAFRFMGGPEASKILAQQQAEAERMARAEAAGVPPGMAIIPGPQKG
jgi:hypothetical protein